MVKKTLLISIFLLSAVLFAMPILHKNLKYESHKTHIVFWTLQMNDYADYLNNIITEYENSHPDIKIIWVDVPFSEGEKRTLAAVLSDNPPDLINLNPDFSAMLAQKGALTEIPTEKLIGFNQEIIDASKYNGKLYLIPWYATSAVTIYNKSEAEKANIKLPKTYNDMAAISKNIKLKTGKYSTLIPLTENDTMLKILNKYGVNSYNNINSDKAIKVFDIFKQMYRFGYLPTETVNQTHREALEKYMSGEIVFFQSGANFLNMIKENAPDTYKNTDVIPQLKGSLGQNDFSLMNFIIPAKSKNKDAALDFCLYLTNDKNQLQLAKMTNVLATKISVINNEFYNDETDLISKARSISAKQLFNLNPTLVQSRNQKEINTLINTAVQSILLDKNNTNEILNNTSVQWKSLISE